MSALSSKDLYDELDPLYRAIWGDALHHGLWRNRRESVEEARRNLVDLIVADLPPKGRVADIGCGYGALARELVERFHGKVLAVTDSAVQAQHIPAHPNLLVRTGNWLDQEIDAASLDAAVAVESLSHFSSFDEFFQHLRPALRDGGTLTVADWFSENGDRPLLRHLAATGGLPPWRSRRSLEDAARRHGFRVVRSRDLTREVAPTWSHLFGRAALLPLRKPTLVPCLVRETFRHPALLWAFPFLRLLFETRDLEYHLTSFQK